MLLVSLVDLPVQIPDLIDGLYGQLSAITNTQTRTGTLRCMRTITSQFLKPSLTHLLNKPLPWDEYVTVFYGVPLITLSLSSLNPPPTLFLLHFLVIWWPCGTL